MERPSGYRTRPRYSEILEYLAILEGDTITIEFTGDEAIKQYNGLVAMLKREEYSLELKNQRNMEMREALRASRLREDALKKQIEKGSKIFERKAYQDQIEIHPVTQSQEVQRAPRIRRSPRVYDPRQTSGLSDSVPEETLLDI